MNTPITDLTTKGFVTITYPEHLRSAVNETIQLWKAFCALPIEVKKGLPYSNNADGVGYELKDGAGNKADRKENLDVTTAGEVWLRQNIKGINNQVALDFVQSATALAGLIKPVILDFARQAENAFGIKDFSKEVGEGEDAFFIRFIHYFGDRISGDEIASAHTDQSGFTLHLFESAPGLQCLSHSSGASGRKWIDMPVSSGETVIIPSMQMQLRSQGGLLALCHRVVATRETAKTGRYSAVCFVQLKRTPKYDKGMHGRLQEKEPGFNYSLSHADFSKLFKA